MNTYQEIKKYNIVKKFLEIEELGIKLLFYVKVKAAF
jgi:hypothetical protein